MAEIQQPRRVSAATVGDRVASRFIAGIAQGRDPFSAPAPPDSVAGVEMSQRYALRALISRFLPYARRYTPQLVALSLIRILIPVAEVGALWVFKIAVDQMFVTQSAARLPIVVLLLGGTMVVLSSLQYLDSVLGQWVSGRVVLDARQDVLGHLVDLRPDFYDDHPLGDVLTRLSSDVAAVETMVVSTLRDAFGHLARVVVLTFSIVALSWRLTAAIALLAPLFLLLSRSFALRTKVISREQRLQTGAIASTAEDILANVPMIQAHGTQRLERERFRERGRALFAIDMVAARLQAKYEPAITGIEYVGAMMVIWLGTHELSAGRLTLGSLFVFIAVLNQLFPPVRALGRLGPTLTSAAASAERVVELLDTPTNLPGNGRSRSFRKTGTGQVEFDRVTFAYEGAGRPALRDVSFRLEPGRVVALVGPSGSGKSTIVKLLMRWQEPGAGAIRLDGVDIRELQVEQLRDRIALVPQDAPMVDRSIAENIAYGQQQVGPGDLAAVAQQADAEAFIATFAGGYDALVGPRGRRLSGGQRQRIAIARALLRRAPILILDEPTSGLDANSADRIIEPIHRLMSERATLLVSHNLRMVHEADEILVLDQGCIVERGTHAELRARHGLYEQLYQASLPEQQRRLS